MYVCKYLCIPNLTLPWLTDIHTYIFLTGSRFAVSAVFKTVQYWQGCDISTNHIGKNCIHVCMYICRTVLNDPLTFFLLCSFDSVCGLAAACHQTSRALLRCDSKQRRRSQSSRSIHGMYVCIYVCDIHVFVYICTCFVYLFMDAYVL